MTTVAVFVTPHGFGHAARAAAIMAELLRQLPKTHFEIFTEVPRWFFAESLPPCFTYHRLACDVGLVQRSPLQVDLDQTVARLDASASMRARVVERVAKQLERLGCRLVVADIAPLGIAVAERLHRPSVLVENFTWDWIYSTYRDAPERLLHHARKMAPVFSRADLRLQAEPVCHAVTTAIPIPPVARSPRSARADVRWRLGVPENDSMILLSMGGVRWDYGRLTALEKQHRAWIVVPGGARVVRRRGRLILLPFHSQFFHPDLVFAADLVVGKLGYSTVAETFLAGAAMAFVTRPGFPESPILQTWVSRHLPAHEIEEESFRRGDWLPRVTALLAAGRRPRERENGARSAARVITELL